MDYQIAGSHAVNSPPESLRWQVVITLQPIVNEEWRPTSNYVNDPVSDFPGFKIIATLAKNLAETLWETLRHPPS